MIKRKQLGQHFLNSNAIAKSIVSEAKITKEDTVFELGTGLGILTPLLCKKANKVISVDMDEKLVRNAKPYSKSKDAIEWLAQTSFSHGVIMVQKEFADKLLANSSKRKAVSIIANHAFEIKKISKVGKNNFSPSPKVDSVILKIIQKNTMKKDLIQTINKIFSYRRKTVKNILKQFNKETVIDKRLDDLSGDEIIHLANQILEK